MSRQERYVARQGLMNREEYRRRHQLYWSPGTIRHLGYPLNCSYLAPPLEQWWFHSTSEAVRLPMKLGRTIVLLLLSGTSRLYLPHQRFSLTVYMAFMLFQKWDRSTTSSCWAIFFPRLLAKCLLEWWALRTFEWPVGRDGTSTLLGWVPRRAVVIWTSEITKSANTRMRLLDIILMDVWSIRQIVSDTRMHVNSSDFSRLNIKASLPFFYCSLAWENYSLKKPKKPRQTPIPL